MAYLYTRACIKYSEVLFKTVTLKPGHINKFEYLKHQHLAMTKLNMSHIVHIFTLTISCTDGELTYFILPQYNSFYGQHITEGVEEFYQIQNSTP